MPELPEIETVRLHLEKHVVGKMIQDVVVNRPKTLNVSIDEFTEALKNQSFISAQRRGKVIRLRLPTDRSMLFHFMIDGYLRFFLPAEAIPDGANVIILFDSGERLSFYRMHLGFIHLFSDEMVMSHPDYAELGPEPLDAQFSLAKFEQMLKGRRGMIKPLLMDQKFIAGIGNVYSNEILFCSRILPVRKTSTLHESEIDRLYKCLLSTLQTAVQQGGVSEYPFMTGDELTGGYTNQLQVYERTGQPCPTCGRAVETVKVGGRNAFFCPDCQH
ncbi:bifunctional DNA-formamidopyrimidine glycosylase/DNA-(apurinic or apyrimidinic site) lyase [Heliobacterium chlorum]|uniref:Formamidopyrimidine-DNA glycosylase n=1 Tax=Heliobacterium chlorum TaxID=2698 RepID=A0ABR7T4L0_HELCL|nr:bifunctional DNA-formamidopyrimidine glycosylase/DNA-(apurinic or apyrimidinic site) lyase [Heliobacterium chlorum]MBC9785718.1 bifunctional DNA-formamidopyrimidine glycosylase/DNA-(apurinic or apyrimidinic site) lyase [Heliobacterium chlorum]